MSNAIENQIFEAEERRRQARSPSEGDFGFTRVWARPTDNTWQVVVGHTTVVT
ncbi:MAG: hypothetical protein JSW27_21165 [Phycisphaerales bacterium]|nr:MAG: hypothetical protein JSW27_21165 [Phycisphaerales bacterium]